MTSPDGGGFDDGFTMHRVSTRDSILLGAETGLMNEISIDGVALLDFLGYLDQTRLDMKTIQTAPEQQDDSFQMGATVTGMDEVGALLLGNNSNRISGVSLLNRGTARYVTVSDMDIMEAAQKGTVTGWIHSHPGNTNPSTGIGSDAADVNVSHFLAQRCHIPTHVALITNRDGSGLTAFMYNDTEEKPENRFKKLNGIKINTPANLSTQQTSRLNKLQYI